MAFTTLRSGIRAYTDSVVNRFIGGQLLEPNLNYWRNIFFAYICAILLPVMFIPLIPGLFLAFKQGFYGLIAADLIIIGLFISITFAPRLTIQTRKVIFVTGLYFITIVLLLYLGSYGPGLTFLYAITVIVVLITRKELAMLTVGLNLLICAGIAIALWNGFRFPYYHYHDYSEADRMVMSWLAISSFGLIFSFLAAVVIPKLFEGLQTIIDSQKLLERKLQSMLREVETKNIELEEFAYTASHDLKEPLRMVRSFMELLKKNYSSKLDEKAGRYIHFAVDGAERMGKLIDDLLHYSRVGRIHTEIRTINLGNLLHQVSEKLKAEKKPGTIEIKIGEMPEIEGVRVTIEMLFNNLISNAVKYQPKNQIPKITVESFTSEKYHHFRVSDNGIGIPEEYQNEIFQLFKRLHTDEEYKGSGLGLAICKKIVTQHGGHIGVISRPGEGSTFEFTLKKEIREYET
ncbi:MAG: hypothetical protein EA360_09460 [Balneolaceae bacterium]|nr:MAG: hypothetical protein EA360_09460 [Balneolaceae bacterium]